MVILFDRTRFRDARDVRVPAAAAQYKRENDICLDIMNRTIYDVGLYPIGW